MVKFKNQNPVKSNGISRREVLKYWVYGVLAAGLLSSILLCGCSRLRGVKGPNIIIISIDTLRADHVSCYGYKKNTTPNIDRLAFQGHCFTNAYTTIPTTLPAHASLFSSLYPKQLSAQRNGEKAPEDATTLAEILNSSGYITAAFVSSMVLDRRYGLAQGFKTYDDPGKRDSCDAEETLDKATVWLGNHSKEPFFLFVHFFDPHTPYYAPESFRRQFGAADISAPPAIEFVREPGRFTADVIGNAIAAYDAEIAYADWALGELMSEVQRLGLDENTVVIFVSDHGETLDELIERYGYAFDHGEFLYAHQLHIPLIIRMPKWIRKEMGIIHTTPVSLVDIMPTILEMVNIKPPSRIAGRSVVPILRGEQFPSSPVFSERRTFGKLPQPFLKGESYSVIEGKWHFIFATDQENELYNLTEDPRERFNLLRESKKVNELKNELHKWLEQVQPLFGPSVFETDKEAVERLRSLGYTE